MLVNILTQEHLQISVLTDFEMGKLLGEVLGRENREGKIVRHAVPLNIPEYRSIVSMSKYISLILQFKEQS